MFFAAWFARSLDVEHPEIGEIGAVSGELSQVFQGTPRHLSDSENGGRVLEIKGNTSQNDRFDRSLDANSLAELAVGGLSAEQRQLLSELPMACTSDLALPHSDSEFFSNSSIPDHSKLEVPEFFTLDRDSEIDNTGYPTIADPSLEVARTAVKTDVSTVSFDQQERSGAPHVSRLQRYDLGLNPPPNDSSATFSETRAIEKPADWAATGIGIASLPNPHPVSTSRVSGTIASGTGTEDPHLGVFSRTEFPSAAECAVCHQQTYDEWASSSHAYAAISPMFHVFEDKINKLTQGTIGYFCMRCHAPVATTMGLRRDQAIWDGPAVFKEGVTCVACHRVKSPYTKSSGERRIEPGDIYSPVYGASDGQGLDLVRKYKQHFKVKTDPADSSLGQPIHRRAIQFEEMRESTFCVSCHQVAVQPGIKLEVVWDQYRASPAYQQGVSCQDCHMGRVPGMDEGYSVGPAAVVNDKVINPERRHSNHLFYGPGYSIAHPGIFPFNKDADRWSFNDWLEFDWRAGWGTDAFEDALPADRSAYGFPKVWEEVDDRYDAREVIDANLKKLEYKKDIRLQLLENGSKLDGPFFTSGLQACEALSFNYCVTNLTTGHNLPSGSLGAQPQLWLNVVLINPDGLRIWETGYLDSNGDLADLHSLDVLARCVPLDAQLLNFQTKFLTTNVKGTDREMYVPINFDFDQLPFIRPASQPISVLNHPSFIRMEAHSIPPLGSRTGKFVVPARLMQQPGTYRLTARMRSRAEPIYFMRFCGATPEMERMMNEWMVDAHVQSVTFEVK